MILERQLIDTLQELGLFNHWKMLRGSLLLKLRSILSDLPGVSLRTPVDDEPSIVIFNADSGTDESWGTGKANKHGNSRGTPIKDEI